MGSRFHPRESPGRQVFVPEFDIANIPVTVGQYSIFIDSGAYSQPNWWSESGWSWREGDEDGWGREDRSKPDAWIIQKRRESFPVAGVTWYEAEAYCSWLSYQKKKIVRLPNEPEWEYAARGDDGRPFPWGEEFDPSMTNTLESGKYDIVESASIGLDVSPFDVKDMSGNIQQWTSGRYTPMPEENFPPGNLYLARGGSFNDTAYGSRVSYRRAYPPGYFFAFLGFRVVISDH